MPLPRLRLVAACAGESDTLSDRIIRAERPRGPEAAERRPH
jgi:hypothetical protein